MIKKDLHEQQNAHRTIDFLHMVDRLVLAAQLPYEYVLQLIAVDLAQISLQAKTMEIGAAQCVCGVE